MPTQRFNTSRRQVLRSYTSRTFYPDMYASNVPYDARDTAYGAASTAEQIGQLVGTLGVTALSQAAKLEQARVDVAAEAARQREETKKAEALSRVAETAKAVVPWVALAVVVAVVVPKIFNIRSI